MTTLKVSAGMISMTGGSIHTLESGGTQAGNGTKWVTSSANYRSQMFAGTTFDNILELKGTSNEG